MRCVWRHCLQLHCAVACYVAAWLQRHCCAVVQTRQHILVGRCPRQLETTTGMSTAQMPQPAAASTNFSGHPCCAEARCKSTPCGGPQVLEKDGSNVKALYRRAQAYLALSESVEAETGAPLESLVQLSCKSEAL